MSYLPGTTVLTHYMSGFKKALQGHLIFESSRRGRHFWAIVLIFSTLASHRDLIACLEKIYGRIGGKILAINRFSVRNIQEFSIRHGCSVSPKFKTISEMMVGFFLS